MHTSIVYILTTIARLKEVVKKKQQLSSPSGKNLAVIFIFNYERYG